MTCTPCPFCGEHTHVSPREWYERIKDERFHWAQYECGHCGARGPINVSVSEARQDWDKAPRTRDDEVTR